MFDESGMLSREVLLGYVYGELSPIVRREVEEIISKNDIYRDIIEGLRAMPDKASTEHALADLDIRVAQKAGIRRRQTGIHFLPYRNIAAILTGALFILGITWLVVNLNTSGDAGRTVENQTKEEQVAELKNQPTDESESITEAPVEERQYDDTEIIELPDEPRIEAIEEDSEPISKEITAEPIAAAPGKPEKKSSTKVPPPVEKSIAQSKMNETNNDEDFSDIKNGNDSGFIDAFSSRQGEAKESLVASAEEDKTVFLIDQVQQIPTFPGDMDGLTVYLQQNINYPKKARRNKIEGTVFLTFVINKTGQATQVEILSGVDKDLDNEAKRIVEKMPPWNPGMKSGKPVAVKYTLPVKFKLPD